MPEADLVTFSVCMRELRANERERERERESERERERDSVVVMQLGLMIAGAKKLPEVNVSRGNKKQPHGTYL